MIFLLLVVGGTEVMSLSAQTTSTTCVPGMPSPNIPNGGCFRAANPTSAHQAWKGQAGVAQEMHQPCAIGMLLHGSGRWARGMGLKIRNCTLN